MIRLPILWLFCLTGLSLWSQKPTIEDDQLDIFLDCRYCDLTFLRKEVGYVNYVRDPNVADVHIISNTQRTGAGGLDHTIRFLGRQQFEGTEHELNFSELPGSSRQERQVGFGKMIQTGLVPFWMNTSLAQKLDLSVKHDESADAQVTTDPVSDPWDSWIFSVEAGGSANSDSRTNRYVGWARLRADRVSEEWRIRNLFYTRYDGRRFEQGEDEVIISRNDRSYASSSVVWSVSDHWSVGAFGSLSSSTFSNLDLSTRMAPAVEFSIFPYEEVHKKELTIAYRISHIYRDYAEETIFLQLSENLFNQSLVMAARLQQPWGSLYAELEGSHFWHDFRQNRIEFEGYLSLRVARGLSITLGNEIEFINDQRSLPKRDISLEELLLAQRQSATSFRLSGQFGFKYTFGSIYNNVVNTRL